MKNAYFTTKCVSSHILKSFSPYNTPQPTLAMQQSQEVFAGVDQHDCKRLKGILEILKNQEQDEEQKTKIYGWLEILEIAYLE